MQKNENESAPLVYVGSSWKNAASLDAVHVALQAQETNSPATGVPRDRMDIMWKLTTCQFSPKSFDLQTVAIHVASVVRLRHG